MKKILLIESDDFSKQAITIVLKRIFTEVQVDWAKNLNEAFVKTSKFFYQACLIGLDLDYKYAGLELIDSVQQKGIFTCVLSSYENKEIIHQAYQLGAHDYISKPANKKDLEGFASRLNLFLNKQKDSMGLSSLVKTNNLEFRHGLERLSEVVNTDQSILFEGETGTGKTYLAKLIHESSNRKEGPFIHINCSEISESLIESELFGHVKGSFSGAIVDRKGKLELAHGGTLFLDELGTTSNKVQLKLLKAIEEKQFFPIGSEKLVESDFRVISATCDDLSRLVKQGKFREDLYFRLYGHNVYLRPLRKRREDIALLIDEMIQNSRRKIVLTQQALEALESYFWPGNLRELNKVIGQLLCFSKGVVEIDDLPKNIKNNEHPLGKNSGVIKSDNLLTEGQLNKVRVNGIRGLIEEIENEVVKYFLTTNHGKVRKTMSQIKMSNSSFYRIVDRISPTQD